MLVAAIFEAPHVLESGRNDHGLHRPDAKAHVVPCGTTGGVSTAERFREAVEAGDHGTLRGLLAKDVKLLGPSDS